MRCRAPGRLPWKSLATFLPRVPLPTSSTDLYSFCIKPRKVKTNRITGQSTTTRQVPLVKERFLSKQTGLPLNRNEYKNGAGARSVPTPANDTESLDPSAADRRGAGGRSPRAAPALSARFESLFGQRTGWATLDRLLRRIRQHKGDLLRVLARPDMPLHTNASETDIRDYVTVRKISGGTRSDLGRQCRDTFASLKKTCRKLGVSFWAYLTDRLTNAGRVPPLADLMRQHAA
jgi:hypothetical protein